MTKRLIATLGLPASGKTTWAKSVINSNPAGTVVRINKDDLRAMFHDSLWDGNKTERQIIQAQSLLIEAAFCDERVHTVIIDDTNFAGHIERLREFVESLPAHCGKVTFEVKDFTDVPVKECIERDLKRPNSVGHKVINKMNMRYLGKKFEPPVFDPDKGSAILVDIDGTLAHMAGRSPYDYSRVSEDRLDGVVASIVEREAECGATIIVMSGRPERYTPKGGQVFDVRNETEAWLDAHGFPYNELYMRVEGDTRDDAIVKGELYEKHVEPFYNVRYVLDDRDRVVDMWRARGLKVLQVGDGDF